MGMPADIGIIDTMVGFPSPDRSQVYKFIQPHLRDEESKSFSMPAAYMFKDVPPEIDPEADPVAVVLMNMDAHGVERAMVNVAKDDREAPRRAIRDFPDRFIACAELDPNGGMDTIRLLERLVADFGVRAVTTTPFAYRVAINDARYYPLYAKCVELDLPIFVTAGVPGPRVPMADQKVELIDEVCWFFPELKFVMRHGAEPWEALAVKLMIKWPNLYYSTSAFAPRYYPQAIIDYANTRGADKIIYAGYFPAGLTYDRIFSELPDVAFKDDVWPKFLRTNAERILGLGSAQE
ncbi:MAG: amidohydrolase family protein [Candidatus Neomicrothrix subdominans]|jgi:predicted TIM-barrel fold metal-dependent hydrolase